MPSGCITISEGLGLGMHANNGSSRLVQGDIKSFQLMRHLLTLQDIV